MTAFPLRLPFTKKTADNRAAVSSVSKKETAATVKTEITTKPKLSKRQQKILEWLRRNFVIRFIHTEAKCVYCSGSLPRMYHGTVRRWCNKRCHWARHNDKYYYTERGNKKGWHSKGAINEARG